LSPEFSLNERTNMTAQKSLIVRLIAHERKNSKESIPLEYSYSEINST